MSSAICLSLGCLALASAFIIEQHQLVSVYDHGTATVSEPFLNLPRLTADQPLRILSPILGQSAAEFNAYVAAPLSSVIVPFTSSNPASHCLRAAAGVSWA